MTTEVAFLRAVNVAGHASLKMTALRRVFESAGCTNVRTYIQSGNVIFDAPRATSAAIRQRIGRGLDKLVGEEVAVAYRTLRELLRAADAAPFASLEEKGDIKLYVGFLIARPRKAPTLPLSFPKDGLELTQLARREVFVVSRKVKGRYGFPNNLIEKELDVPATTRNWNTVKKIIALASERDVG